MRILTSYVSTQVVLSILLVLLVMLSLDTLGALIEEIDDIENDYTFLEACYFLLLGLPGKLRMWLPFAAMVGCLVGLGSLANNSELTVMRAAGVSTRRIVWIVFRPTLVLILIAVVLNEYVAPYTDQMAEARKSLLRSGSKVFSHKAGVWNKEGTEYMHFNSVQPGGEVHGIAIYSFNDERVLLKARFAHQALYVAGEGRWILQSVVETVIDRDQTKVQRFKTRRWDSELTPDLLDILILEPQQLSSTALLRYARYREEQDLNSDYYMLEFWRKVFQPLSILSLVLIAVSFVFGPLREVTMGYRVFAGVIVGVVFWTLQELLGPASLVYNFSTVQAVLLPIVLCMVLGTLLLRRV
jgi:lipopolysaccharide export system permease protein